jgi:hypothetical protein
VSKGKRLKVMGPADQKLGRATIMDRALAQRHGATYVHAAAFAIDVDRVRALEPDDSDLPFAWEVWLTESYLVRFLREPAHVSVLEDLCMHVLDLPRPRGDEEPPFGSQLPFAVYAGVAHTLLPNALGNCFRSWKKPPVDLLQELEPLRKDATLLARLANHCLDADVDPPLVEPVREALLKLTEP